MNRQEQLDKLLAEGDGILQTSAVIAAGVTKPVLYQYIRQNNLEQAAHGIYVSRDAWVDGMYLLHLCCAPAVFSHESALFFHDLTDREPSPYSVSVQRGYSPTRLKADGITVYTVKKELYPIGITSAKTPFTYRTDLRYGTYGLRFDSMSERYGSTDISGCFETIYKTNRQKPEYSDAVRSTVPRRKSDKAIFGGSPIIQTARQL
mgnify:CR=1 FL=1